MRMHQILRSCWIRHKKSLIITYHLSLITRYWSDWTGAISCSFERLMRRVSLHSLWQEGQSSEEEVPSDSSGSRLNKWVRIGEGREARCGLVSYLFPAFGSWSPAEAKLLWLNFKSPFFVILYISWASTRNDWLECTVPLPWGSFHHGFYCRASVDSTGSQDAAAKALRVAWKEWRGNGGNSHARHARTHSVTNNPYTLIDAIGFSIYVKPFVHCIIIY